MDIRTGMTIAALATLMGCSAPPPSTAPAAKEATAAQPVAPKAPPPAVAAAPKAAAEPAPPKAAPAAPKAPTPSAPPKTATAPTPPKAAPAAPSKPAATPSTTTATAAPAKPRLDLKTLEQRLKSTDAIGVMTKLSLKNQVDDLVTRFRNYHAGSRPPTLDQLRPSFDLLLMKVLSLLQDKDPALASDIHASRDVIWSVLADPDKLSQFS